jgi:GT2 family glycosyltransferase
MVLRLLADLFTRDKESVQELELIVVDNNSKDGSVEAIRREFPAVKLVAQTENRGFAGGVNPGIRVATQPLVLLLNSDVRTSRSSIEEAARYMDEHPEVGVLGPRILHLDRSPAASCFRDPSLTLLTLKALGLSRLKLLNFARYHQKVFTEPAEVDVVAGCAMMIRRDFLVELGGLDEDFFMYFEETDFCFRARERGKQVHYAPIGEFLHEAGGTSKTVKLRTFLDFRRSEILFHRKRGGPAAALAARGLLALAAALRVPPLAALSLFSEEAQARLDLNWHGLLWLLNPFSGLVPDVDRSQ